MAVEGSSATTIFTAVLALYFALGALYAFSGAGFIGKLPLQQGVILAVGVIYLLRAKFLPTEIKMVMNEGYPFRFVVYSALSLLTGLLYLGGYFSARIA